MEGLQKKYPAEKNPAGLYHIDELTASVHCKNKVILKS